MFECKVCDVKFKCQYDLNRHFNTKKHKDRDNKNNYCRSCYKSLSSKFNRDRHERSCNTYQTINNINNTFNGLSIIVNCNSNPESFVISIEDLIKKNLTTSLQKVILEDMLETEDGIMDLIGKFDELLEEAREQEIYDHNHFCDVTKHVVKVDEFGNEEIVEEEWTPFTHPDYNWKCRHTRNNFKISSYKLSELLVRTFLDKNANPVVTHLNSLGKEHKLLYKHLKTLHSDQILLDFLSKSSKKDYFEVKDDYRPSTEIKKKYPHYYENLEDKALLMKENYNNVARRNRRKT